MNPTFRSEVLGELDETGNSLYAILDHARERQEMEPTDELNRLIATIRLAYQHIGSAVALLESTDG